MSDDIQPTTLNRLGYDVFSSFAMMAAMQLELFTPLADGARTRQELAAALGVDAGRLLPLLDLLVASGLLVRSGEAFENSPEAQKFLVKGRPDYRGNLAGFYEGLWRAALRTAESLRDGGPAARLDFSGDDDQALLAFFRRQYPSSLGAGRELGAKLDFAGYTHLADVGGGTGGAAIGICSAQPALRSTVYDLPSVVRVAETFIAEAGLSDRIDVAAVDLAQQTIPKASKGTHDIALVRSVLQVLDPEAARGALRSAHALLKPGGQVIITGSVLRDSREGPASALARGLVFLNVYDHGRSYTESEHQAWLTECGFVDARVDYEFLRDGSSVIRARRR